ncbi:carotenoid oxygenase family protein [Streptomyces xanthochromogenes]|uniref:carotenoid oxygenase family protein n=1 Tax=Streptomyces xanthochromogenes TaxID=67384 RepID=UPI0034186F71
MTATPHATPHAAPNIATTPGTAASQPSAPHLAGNFAPVAEELTTHELTVTGAIPPELTGWYVRNGPNPQDAASAHWFFGDGMVHGVRLEGGRARSYRNRWVRTSTFTDGARVHDRQGRTDLTAGAANTHVVRHAGRTLALVESSFPYALDCRPGRELETLGSYDFDGRLTTAMTAHPKTCPVTGELHFFGYGALDRPFLNYHRADERGELVVSRPVEVPAATMMHDFHLTASHVVFMDLPAVSDLETAMRPGGGLPYRWDAEYGARLGVLRRDDPYGEVRWLTIDPCYVFHALNAYDLKPNGAPGDGGPADSGPGDGTGLGERIVLHVVRYERLGANGPTLWKWTLDLATGTVREEQLDDQACEFPRVDDRLAGLESRFGHVTVSQTPSSGPISGALLRYDLRTGAVVRHEFGAGRVPAEAAFAPADGRPGGPGWLLSYVYDAARDASDLVILDADNLAAPPVATVHLPQRVPFGFHGNWLADE